METILKLFQKTVFRRSPGDAKYHMTKVSHELALYPLVDHPVIGGKWRLEVDQYINSENKKSSENWLNHTRHDPDTEKVHTWEWLAGCPRKRRSMELVSNLEAPLWATCYFASDCSSLGRTVIMILYNCLVPSFPQRFGGPPLLKKTLWQICNINEDVWNLNRLRRYHRKFE